LTYLKRSLLPDGRLARYYELQSNRPLYMNREGKQYFLTYDDAQLPDHYGWKVSSRLSEIERRYQEMQQMPADARIASVPEAPSVARIVAELDDRGRWVSVYAGERIVGQAKFNVGERYLSSETFAENLTSLADFLKTLNRRD
jgi:hypothetical protein